MWDYVQLPQAADDPSQREKLIEQYAADKMRDHLPLHLPLGPGALAHLPSGGAVGGLLRPGRAGCLCGVFG